MVEVAIEKVSDGLGIGEGNISGTEIDQKAGPELVRRVDVAINSEKVIVPLDRDSDGNLVEDDGCGDGRFTKLVMRGREILKKSLHRPKVFGGGATMGAASLIGSGEAAGKTLQDIFRLSMHVLRESGVKFGAHTADHVADGKCGCGAIDEAPRVIGNAVKYQREITDQFEALGVPTEGLHAIFANFTTHEQGLAAQLFAGEEVMSDIQADGDVVVKELGGSHIESRIILNLVEGTTVNQNYIRRVSEGKVDVFGVDVWRMNYIANRLHADDAAASLQAFQSMLVYTLATAAVLTKGDLPVFVVRPQHANQVVEQAA